MTSDPPPDSWQCCYLPTATSTRNTATVSNKRPMIVVRRFLRCLRVYEMWLGVAGWRDNSHMHLLLEYKVYKPVSILLSHFISWQTTTSLATGNSCLHTLWKKDACKLRSWCSCQWNDARAVRDRKRRFYVKFCTREMVTNRRATSRAFEIFESL